jgi:hypothetical protein
MKCIALLTSTLALASYVLAQGPGKCENQADPDGCVTTTTPLSPKKHT